MSNTEQNTNLHQEVDRAEYVNPHYSPEEITRRRFLGNVAAVLTGVGGVAVAVPVGIYIIAPLFNQPPEPWVDLGPISDYLIGQTKQVTFDDPSPLPWAGITAKISAWLRRDGDRQFTAYEVNCTHLGCPVSWLPGANLFMCPCHGGVYYPDGTVAAGPPPQPLYRYETRVQPDPKTQVLRVQLKATGAKFPTE
jgi:menaquinol-cytochrome c reductase iron-sulfur subunit